MNTNFNNIAICDFLSTYGHKPIKKCGNNLWYLSPLRNERTASFKVNLSRNTWYDFGVGLGGGISKLLKLFFHTENIPDIGGIVPLNLSEVPSFEKTQFSILRVVPGLQGALLNYINARGITDNDLIYKYCKTIIFHNSRRNKDYYAIGFRNDSGGYEIRNQHFKGATPPKDFTLINNGNRICTVFEGFIDFLTYLTINDSRFAVGDCDYMVLNSTSIVSRIVSTLRSYDKVFSFMDNDYAGKEAFSFLASSLDNITDMSDLYAPCKDLNEYLCNNQNKEI